MLLLFSLFGEESLIVFTAGRVYTYNAQESRVILRIPKPPRAMKIMPACFLSISASGGALLRGC